MSAPLSGSQDIFHFDFAKASSDNLPSRGIFFDEDVLGEDEILPSLKTVVLKAGLLSMQTTNASATNSLIKILIGMTIS